MEADASEEFWGLSRDAAKVVSLLFLGVGSFIVGLLPAGISRRNLRSHPIILTGLLCFGAGVLMATALVHMLPEVRKDLPGMGYAEIVFCVGFIIVYLIDEMIHFCCGEAIQHTHSDPVSIESPAHDHGHSHGHSHNHNDQERLLPEPNQASYGAIANNIVPPKPNEIDCEHQQQHEREDEEINARICHTSHVAPCSESNTGHFGLLVALSVHALLEGLAIGVQNTAGQVKKLWFI